MRRTGIRAAFVLAMVFGLGLVAYAATVDEILAHVEKRCASMKDLSCTMTMQMNMMGQRVKAEGGMKMVLPNQFATDLVMNTPGSETPMRMKMVSDGRVMYQEMKAGDKLVVNKIDMEASGMNKADVPGMGVGMAGGMGSLNPDPARSVTEFRRFLDLKVMPDQTLEGDQKAWVIEGTFKPEYYRLLEEQAKGGTGGNAEVLKSQMAGMRIFVGQQDEYINRMEFLSNDEEKTKTGVIELRNLKFDQGLTPDVFQYAPPEGVEVNDMTETMRKQVETMRKAEGVPEKKPEGNPAPAGVLKVGVPAPAFTVKTLEGKDLDLAQLRGKPVLLFFWATWHKASLQQLVTVNKLAAEHKGAFDVVALSLDEAGAADEVRKTVKEKGITLSVGMAEEAVLNAYWITEIPSYVLLDAEGKVAGSESKPRALAALEKTLEKMTKK